MKFSGVEPWAVGQTGRFQAARDVPLFQVEPSQYVVVWLPVGFRFANQGSRDSEVLCDRLGSHFGGLVGERGSCCLKSDVLVVLGPLDHRVHLGVQRQLFRPVVDYDVLVWLAVVPSPPKPCDRDQQVLILYQHQG